MRAKPIFTYSLLAGALALPGHALALGLGKLTVESALGQPLSARIELTSVTREDLDSLRARIADPGALPPEQPHVPGHAVARPRSRSKAANGTPYLRVTSPGLGPGAVPRPAGRARLGVRPRRARIHVPARSARACRPPAATEPVTPARAGTPARTSAAPAPRAPRSVIVGRWRASGVPAASATAPSGGGDQYTVRARRHAAADRDAVQARRRHARADARRRCSAATRRRSKATT